ncbi:unnamed protein product [Urochloa humidicola]
MGSRAKKLVKTEAEGEPKQQQQFHDDLVLEIVARCPAIAGVIRFAAVSKPIRRGILNAPFLRRRLRGLLRRHGGPPVSKLLIGLYHETNDPRRPPAFVPASDAGADSLPPSVAALPPAPIRDVAGDDDSASAGGECEFGAYLPVVSRRSLLVLRRRCRNGGSREHLAARHGTHPVELSVCNPATGERRVLPPHGVDDMSAALLDADTFAFKLLVAELSINNPSTLYAQVFSSEEGEWAPSMALPIARKRGGRQVPCEFAGFPRPVVVGDTVHWLCTAEFGDCILTWRWRGAVEEREALIVMLPQRVHLLPELKKCLAVLPPPPGSEASLGFVYLERGEVVVWAREKRSGMKYKWKLWRRIQEASIPRPVNLWDGWLAGARLSCYCEGSGTLLLRAGDEAMSPLLLDIGNMEVSKLDARKWELNQNTDFCPYEVDLLSYMLFLMKRF